MRPGARSAVRTLRRGFRAELKRLIRFEDRDATPNLKWGNRRRLRAAITDYIEEGEDGLDGSDPFGPPSAAIRVYGHFAPPRASISAPEALSTSSVSGLSIFPPRPLSAPPVFVNTNPFSLVTNVPFQYKIPLHTHCTFGGHGDTRSSARNVLSSFNVNRRSYVRSPHDGELHVPANRSSDADA